MASELNRHTWPVDGEDATTSVGDGAAVLSRCPSYAATSITPALDEATGEVHGECSGDITRGDGDTTRGDGEAEDNSGVVVVTPSGDSGVVTPMVGMNAGMMNTVKIRRPSVITQGWKSNNSALKFLRDMEGEVPPGFPPGISNQSQYKGKGKGKGEGKGAGIHKGKARPKYICCCESPTVVGLNPR